jgi:hypothetical protein
MLNTLVRALNAIRLPRTISTSLASVESEYQSARSAARQQDTQQTMDKLERAFTADPRYVSRADADPAFQPFRARIFDILGRLTATTRILADDQIDRAGRAIESGKPQHVQEAVPEANILLSLARSAAIVNRYPELFIAARAAQLSHEAVQTYLSQAAAAPNHAGHSARAYAPAQIDAHPANPRHFRRYRHAPFHPMRRILDRFRRAAASRFQPLWRRFPLLVLFVAWISLGLAVGVASVTLRILAPGLPLSQQLNAALSVWGMGLLVLVGAGFVVGVWRSQRHAAAG